MLSEYRGIIINKKAPVRRLERINDII